MFRGYLFLCTQQEVKNVEEADKSQIWIHQTRVCSYEEEHYLSTRYHHANEVTSVDRDAILSHRDTIAHTRPGLTSR